MKATLVVAIAALLLLVAHWTDSQQPELSDKALAGRALFNDASLGGTIHPGKNTGLSCAMCHADFDEKARPDGLIRAGHSVVGVPSRLSAKGGMLQGDAFHRSAGGSGFCAAHFLQKIPADKVDAMASLTPEQAEAFMAYFTEISLGKQGPEFTMQMLSKEEAQTEAAKIAELEGDAEEGWKLFNAACNVCHLTGTKRSAGPALVTRRATDKEYRTRVADYVRGGGSLMPFFAEDRLSDQQVADIVEFVVTLSQRR